MKTIGECAGPRWDERYRVARRAVKEAAARLRSPSPQGMHLGYWDATVASPEDAVHRANDVLARLAGIRPQTSVLDAGCGFGGSVAHLERRTGAMCWGCTLLPADAARAARHLADVECTAANRLTAADLASLPYRDATFDVVWAMESTNYLPDVAAFLREARRVLRPGGVLVIWDGMQLPGHAPLRHRFFEAMVGGWGQAEMRTSERLCSMVEDANFVGVTFVDQRAGVHRSLRGLRRAGLAHLVWAVARGHPDRTMLRRSRADIAQWTAFRRHWWTIGTVIARRPEATDVVDLRRRRQSIGATTNHSLTTTGDTAR